MLSEKQVEEYKENGFVIMDYSLSKETLDEIKYYHKNLLDKYPEFRDYCPTLLKYDLNFLKYFNTLLISKCWSFSTTMLELN